MTGPRPETLDFVTAQDCAAASLVAVAGDLSDRRYFRLESRGGTNMILMECGPEDSGQATRFVSVAGILAGLGLSAPRIFAADRDAGLLLLEDFGDRKISHMVSEGDPLTGAAYDDITEVLAKLAREAPSALPCPSAADLAEATRLADDWYPGVDRDALDRFRRVLTDRLSGILRVRPALSLRDFHADNLMWLPERPGAARIGILDFQDAFLTHPAYDLTSLLTDARVDVPPEIATRAIERFAGAIGIGESEIEAAIAVLSAQRNLRILGIFARSARRDGKTAHIPKLPRVHGHLLRALRHPVFGAEGAAVADALPDPNLATRSLA